jgi:hypothetical protein
MSAGVVAFVSIACFILLGIFWEIMHRIFGGRREQ